MTGKVLVTGGAGYIGSHTAKALARAGFTPIIVDDLSTGHRRALRWGAFEQGRLQDEAFLDRVLARHQPIAVLHFAALIAVGESVADPGRYYENNVGGSLALLRAMARHGVRRLVFSSTAAVYGLPTQVPIDETAALAPINPYGQSKLMVERMIGDFAQAHGLEAAILRYFNACGADPEGELGEDHAPETHLIPLALAALAGTGPALKLFGTDYPTPDGTCIRDYIHVSDLADAHVAALAHLLRDGGAVTLNLGTGQGHSVRAILDAIAQIAGRPVPVEIAARRPGDPAVLVAAAERAKQILNWAPRYSDLPSIISTALAWASTASTRQDD